MSEIVEPIEVVENATTDVKEVTIDPLDELERDLANFRESETTHDVEQEPEEQEEPEDFMPDESDLNAVEEFKVQMFLGFCFTLLDGFHVWVYKYISKYEITDDQMSLTETEQNALMNYFKTKRVLEIINKIPPEFIGIIHMEYMYYRRYRQIVKQKEEEEVKEAENKKQLLIEAALKIKRKREEKGETLEKELTKKPPVKKQAVKKKPVKKAAKKKEPIQKT
jgi:hypothetical protein